MDYEFTQQDVQQDARIIEKLKARIRQLESEQQAISSILDSEAIEDGGNQEKRVWMLAENYRNRGRMLVQKQLRVRELERSYDDMRDLRYADLRRALKAEAALQRIACDADQRGIGGDAITIDMLTANAGAIT